MWTDSPNLEPAIFSWASGLTSEVSGSTSVKWESNGVNGAEAEVLCWTPREGDCAEPMPSLTPSSFLAWQGSGP